ncbi:AAA family ATPase [Xanthomonas sontii]|uniref:AAA family ATPase n=1 Tax=Xanthomonas sontii TaxID=2650745 RepID=UPI003F83527A
MGILKPATNKMAYAKIGLYGTAGSGKTRTATEIAIGLHKAIGSTKPIAAFDTEPAFSFVLPMFQKAGIELLVADESRALADLMKFMDEAEKVSDIAIVDSITHVWRDAQESYLARINASRKRQNKRPIAALEFQHWRPIKAAWAEFTDRFLSSKLHMIVCGRAGSVYEYQEKDDGSGKKELITVGTRMATEKELGYEPSLLVEMIADREDGRIVNTAFVQKDRSDTLNGKELRMPNYASFAPHFAALNIGGQHFDSMQARDSQEMFEDADESGWDKEKQQRQIWSEEVKELLQKRWPSQTTDDKVARMAALESVFQTRSWTKVENMRSDVLQDGYHSMRRYIAELDGTNSPKEETA